MTFCLGCGGSGDVERPDVPAPMPDPGSMSTADEAGGEETGTLSAVDMLPGSGSMSTADEAGGEETGTLSVD